MKAGFGILVNWVVLFGVIPLWAASPSTEHMRREEGLLSDSFEISLQPYYDPLTPYQKTGFGPQQGQFAYQNINGLSGVELNVAYLAPRNFEIGGGLDLAFTQAVEGQATPAIGWANQTYIDNQQFSLIGLKILQIGYRVPSAKFTIVPYGALGIYYGKNILHLGSLTFGSDETVTYSKLFATLNAGIRLDYVLFGSLVLGVGAEVNEPLKIADQLSQNGAWTLAGYDDVLKASTDFAFNFGGRAFATVGYLF